MSIKIYIKIKHVIHLHKVNIDKIRAHKKHKLSEDIHTRIYTKYRSIHKKLENKLILIDAYVLFKIGFCFKISKLSE